jgi:hypothetical protein
MVRLTWINRRLPADDEDEEEEEDIEDAESPPEPPPQPTKPTVSASKKTATGRIQFGINLGMGGSGVWDYFNASALTAPSTLL